MLVYPQTKSLLTSLQFAYYNLLSSQVTFAKEFLKSKFNGIPLGVHFWKSRIFLIPLLIIIIFIIIYQQSNPVFDKLTVKAGIFLQEHLIRLFRNFELLMVFTFLCGILLANFVFFRESETAVVKRDLESIDNLKREKRNRSHHFRLTGLKNEYKAGIFLLLVLNMILLVLNVIDIYWVWFHFEWEGQYLKQFVHEGTNLLILSIMISIALVLFFFRGNLNFYKKNSLLKYLSYAWLLQNTILAISVAIRNFWYIHYFALAYKRIGVFIFLILTVYGLYTVFIKVLKRKSSFYVFKSNAYAIYFVLIISSAVNWEIVIAKYNFKHADRAFLHLDFLSTLSAGALPYLDKSLDELERIHELQKKMFPFEKTYMSPQGYYNMIDLRKNYFRDHWKTKSLWSWNLPEYLAYRQLFPDNGNTKTDDQ